MDEAPSPNILDKAIAIFSPERAARRLHARTVLALAGCTGASFTRPALARWDHRAADADGDASADLATLRGRARIWPAILPLPPAPSTAPSPSGPEQGAFPAAVSNGSRLDSMTKAVTAWSDATLDEFKLWAETSMRITRKQNFCCLRPGLPQHLESGDGLAVLPDLGRPGPRIG